jgi:small ligand-binding sensory domain FIST
MAGGGISGADGERFLASSEDLGEGGCALLSFPAGSLRVGTASGITPSGPAYVATSVRGRRILELDGDSPLRKIIAHFNSIGSTANQDTLRAGLYLCDLGDEKGVTGRVITSIDEASGALSLDQEVRPGARVAFGTRDLVGAHRANAGMLQHLASELQGRRPVAGVLLSSANRAELFADKDFEIDAIEKAFPGLPVLGMTTTFELSTGHLQLHSAVLAVVLDV